MTDNPSLSPPNYVSKEAFGGQYVSPRVERPRPHSWEDECDMLAIDVFEAERHLQFVRVDGDASQIRAAEITLGAIRDQYATAKSRCGAEWAHGFSCAVQSGRDEDMLVGTMATAVIRRIMRLANEGGAK
jgi:hypothetical protein